MIDRVLSQNIRRTVEHIDVIGQRTLRSKLLSFIEYMKHDYGKSTFTMPLPYSDLADYLGVDRSAMMREIKKLNEENLILTSKRKITII